MTVTTDLLTPALWPAFEDLFGKQGACYGCWCTAFRLSRAEKHANGNEGNKAYMRRRVEDGPPPGLLALEDGVALGWMQIGPRADVPQWNSAARASAPLAAGEEKDPAAWAISCFFVRSKARGKGLTHLLVAAGVEHARQGGARLLEACPMDRSKDSRSTGLFVGSTRVFEKAGFERLAERRPGRPLMRLAL